MSTHEDDRDDNDGQPASGLTPVESPRIQSDRAPPAGEEDFDVVETDDKGNVLGGGQQREERNLSQDEGGDAPLVRQQDDRQGGGERPREPKSQRNARRRESRERSFAENQRLERDNVELRTRLDALEGRVGTQLEPRLLELGEGQIRQQSARLDSAIADAGVAARAARTKIATAMSSADNDLLMQGLEERDAAIIRETQLKNEKVQVDKMLEKVARPAGDQGDDRQGRDQQRQSTAPGGRQQQQSPLPTRAQHFATEFGREHDWFDARNKADVDSQIVLAIDTAVANDGFDPSSPDYWTEVSERMREKMPWRFTEDGGQQRQDGQRREAPQQRQGQQTPAQNQRRGPPTGGPSDRGGPIGSRKTVTISPARKDAMIQAGAIGADGRVLDSGKYKRLLKSYDEFDRTNVTR